MNAINRIILLLSLFFAVACRPATPTAELGRFDLQGDDPVHEQGEPVFIEAQPPASQEAPSTSCEGPTYSVKVNYSLSPDQLIEAGDYGSVSHIDEWYFLRRDGAPQDSTLVEFQVVVYSRPSPEEVLLELDNRGLRPATLYEILVLAAACPNLPSDDYDIVSMGSRLDHSYGLVRAPYLDRYGGQRRLRLLWLEPRDLWNDGTRFLAAPK